MSERKIILRIWAAVIALLIGSMLLAGILAHARPEYRASPGIETCAAYVSRRHQSNAGI